MAIVMTCFERAERCVKRATHLAVLSCCEVAIIFVKRRRKAVSNGIVHHYESHVICEPFRVAYGSTTPFVRAIHRLAYGRGGRFAKYSVGAEAVAKVLSKADFARDRRVMFGFERPQQFYNEILFRLALRQSCDWRSFAARPLLYRAKVRLK